MLKLEEVKSTSLEKIKSVSEIEKEQIELNKERVNVIERLRDLKPPESTKSSAYKWFEMVKNATQRLKDLNAVYVNTLRVNYEESNHNIINQIESLLVRNIFFSFF